MSCFVFCEGKTAGESSPVAVLLMDLFVERPHLAFSNGKCAELR